MTELEQLLRFHTLSERNATEDAQRTLMRAAADRIAALELALAQIRNGCVDDGDEANQYFRLCPSELRKIVNDVL